MLTLDQFGFTPTRGFLCAHDAGAVTLPDDFAPVIETAMNLPRLLPTGHVRRFLDRLPTPNIARLISEGTDAQARRAMVHYSFLVQSYVWGEAEPSRRLPATLARPIWALAEALGQKPLLLYSSYVLDNWTMLDKTAGVTLDNIAMIQPFASGIDEAWFVLVHVAIEAEAGKALVETCELIAAAAQNDLARIDAALTRMLTIWKAINAIFDRMPERCDPYIYYHRVRPYIHGWKDNPALPDGVIYEGVEQTGGRPHAFRGQTGSQSSIVPTMDALFGLGHAVDPLRQFLDELHDYRPPAQRRLIDAVRAQSTLRAVVSRAGRKPTASLYNACVREVAAFRTRHLEYAARYIATQARAGAGNDTEIGTGGTPFMKYLKKHRDETDAQLLPET